MTPAKRLGLARVGILLLGAVASYWITAHFMGGLVIPGFRRNYLALWLVCALIGWLLIIFRREIRRAVGSIASQLDQMSNSGRIGLITVCQHGDLEHMAKPLNSFLSSTRLQLEQLSALNQELRIQSRTATTEKHDIEAIIRSISEAVIVTNRFDELILANPVAEELLGFRLSRSIRRSIDRIVPDAQLVQMIRETRRNGSTCSRRTVEHTVDQKGAARTFNVTLNCVLAPNGDVAGVVSVLRDITREKEIAEMKTDFVSNVTHELKTPLAAIKAYAEMLIDNEAREPEVRRDFYRIIYSETDRLHRLIENILNFSRIESGVIGLKRKPVSLSEVVEDVLKVACVQAKSKKIDVFMDLAPAHFEVEADPDLIYQCVLNLLSNAIKYTCERGRVTVTVRADEGKSLATCQVTDTGVGIPPDHVPHLFDKFYRSPANDTMAEGTGLGLTLVKYIVETIYEGKVSVTSEVGEGSSFAFELPLMKQRERSDIGQTVT